jgi:hypothetical protein
MQRKSRKKATQQTQAEEGGIWRQSIQHESPKRSFACFVKLFQRHAQLLKFNRCCCDEYCSYCAYYLICSFSSFHSVLDRFVRMDSLRTLSHQVRSFAGKFRGTTEDFLPLDAAKQSASTASASAAQSKLAFFSTQLQSLQQKIAQGEGVDHRWQELQICLDLAEIVLVMSLIPEDVAPDRWFETLYKCFVAEAAEEAAKPEQESQSRQRQRQLQVRKAVKTVSDLVYIHDRATLARVLIRALMLEHPHVCVQVCEEIIGAAASADQLVLKRADCDAQSLSQLQQLLSRFATALSEKQASLRPLFDDMFAQIRHAHWYEASMPKPAALVVKLVGCGQLEVVGRYRPDVSKSEPCYRR